MSYVIVKAAFESLFYVKKRQFSSIFMHIFAQFTCKGGHRQQAGHRLRAVWSDAGMKATFALPMNFSVDIVIFFKGDFSLQKTDVS